MRIAKFVSAVLLVAFSMSASSANANEAMYPAPLCVTSTIYSGAIRADLNGVVYNTSTTNAMALICPIIGLSAPATVTTAVFVTDNHATASVICHQYHRDVSDGTYTWRTVANSTGIDDGLVYRYASTLTVVGADDVQTMADFLYCWIPTGEAGWSGLSAYQVIP